MPQAELLRRIRDCDDEEVLAESESLVRPFEDVLTKTIFNRWPSELLPPDETVWFHGSRLPRSTSFAEGLLPFKVCLPALTRTVEQLALEVGVPSEFLHCGEISGSHSMKLVLAESSGPYGSLFREVVVNPQGAHRDFLDTPEIIYDLAHSVGGQWADRILNLYRERTSRCVVWFFDNEQRTDVLTHALMYVHHVVRGDSDPGFWNTCFNGAGNAVAPERILNVEWLDG